MSQISLLIATLSEESKKQFVVLLQKKNRREDVKNIELFHLLDTDEVLKDVDVLLYGKKSKGAYHALCKRLSDALIDFIATKRFDEEASEDIHVLKMVMASRDLLEKQQSQIAFKLLAKAEVKAAKDSLYVFLNEIYATQIQYAHLNPLLEFTSLLDKHKANKVLLEREENLNFLYASIQDELQHTHIGVADILNRNLQKFSVSIAGNMTYQSLFKILEICNKVGHVSRKYHEILDFVENAYEKVVVSDKMKRKQLNYHILILYYMANTYFRIKNFTKARAYLSAMKDAMGSQNKTHSAQFYPQYVLLDNFIWMYTNHLKKALEGFSSFDFSKHKKQFEFSLDIISISSNSI